MNHIMCIIRVCESEIRYFISSTGDSEQRLFFGTERPRETRARRSGFLWEILLGSVVSYGLPL